VWELTQKISILKDLQTHFKEKLRKVVETPFPRVPVPQHSCLRVRFLQPNFWQHFYSIGFTNIRFETVADG